MKPTVPARATRTGVIAQHQIPHTVLNTKDKLLGAVHKFKFQVYEHKPIVADKEVRLLVFGKKDNDQEIYISTINVPFDQLGKGDYRYEALSYHWGDGEPNLPIYFIEDDTHGTPRAVADVVKLLQAAQQYGGDSPSHMDSVRRLEHRRLYVKPNLYAALKHLRVQQGIVLWVDALCINQDDEEEKQLQISQMNKIYNKAERVCIWLGEGDSESDNAMKFIRDLLLADDPKILMADSIYAKNWHGLVNLMMKPWFSRRWVIQELALAQEATVHCGSAEVHWDDFRDAISLLNRHADTVRALFRNSKEFGHDFWAPGEIESFGATVLVNIIPNIFRRHAKRLEPALGLEVLVSSLWQFRTSDPRDTIMAMRNIAQETWQFLGSTTYQTMPPPPEVDYRKDLFQTYADFVDWVIRRSKSVDIICRYWALPEIGRLESKPQNYPHIVTLPSWILDTSKSGDKRRAESLVGLPGQKTYNACGGREPNVKRGDYSSRSRRSSDARTPRSPGALSEVSAIALNDTQTHNGEKRGTSLQPQVEEARNQKRPLGPALEVAGRDDTAKRIRSDSSASQHLVLPIPTISLNQPSLQQSTLSPYSPTSLRFEQLADTSLQVEGLRIAAIGWRSDPIPDGVIPAKCLQKCGWIKEAYYEHARKNELPDIDKVMRTLVADRGADGKRCPSLYHRACLSCLMLYTPNDNLNTRELIRNEKVPEFHKDFLKRVQAVTWDRVFLETKHTSMSAGDNQKLKYEPLVGLGPPGTEKGDEVCILFGCSVPVILRHIRLENGDNYYKFIGEAFIYGQMEGEALSIWSDQELNERKQTFRLM